MKIFTDNQNQEKGLSSIVITMFLMIVITLTILGFAQLSRREQRQALDRQLSTQAFYAAETGVNDAVGAIEAALDSGGGIPEYDNCEAGVSALGGGNLGTDTNVSYTCVLIDPTPRDLRKPVGTDTAEVFAIRPTAGNINQITLKWGKEGGGANFNCPWNGATASFPPAGAWGCDPGILRVDLVQASDGFTRDNLNSKAFTAFFYPGTVGDPTVNYSAASGTANAGLIRQVRCEGNSETPCGITITGLTPGNSFFLHVRSMYATNSLVVSAADGGTTKELRGSQVSIDSTGKANDVLRRINVRLPLQEGLGEGAPPFALQTARDLCKRFVVYPTGVTDEASVSNCSL